MSHLLILYGTTDGQTGKVARALDDTFRAGGCVVDVVNAAHGAVAPPEGYDGVIVCASIHAGGYQRAVKRWVRTHHAELNRIPAAFVSVCLGVLENNPETERDLKRIMAEFFEATGWHPGVTKMVAGALKYTRYSFLKRWVMRRIVAKAGGDTDTSKDYEYTDWTDLREFAHAFALQSCGKILDESTANAKVAETYLV